jgi:hypothetical protein
MLPPNLFKKYLARFDELIQKGHEIYDAMTFKFGESIEELNDDNYIVDRVAFAKLRVNYVSLLEQVIPLNSPQRKLIEEPGTSYTSKQSLENHISVLEALREDFKNGFLGDLLLQIEVEIAADYMGQAEQLLDEGQSGNYDHVPAAVLSGAVLEKALRTLCGKQVPPIAIVNSKGEPLTLNPLIEALKKAAVFNELKAKQLRAWADIRNKAAHGEFDQFSRHDVEVMIRGIEDFLATSMT